MKNLVLDKPDMPVNTLVEIWNRPKHKRSSPQTHRGAVAWSSYPKPWHCVR